MLYRSFEVSPSVDENFSWHGGVGGTERGREGVVSQNSFFIPW
jgi:hypothetical protein